MVGGFFTTEPPGMPVKVWSRNNDSKHNISDSVPGTSLVLILSLHQPLVAQLVKNPPAMQKLRVQFLGQDDLLEKG